MKKLLAIVISMAMVLAMLPVGVFADEHEESCVAEIGSQHYGSLQDAINAAGTTVDGVEIGTNIKLVKDNIVLNTQLTINKDITIDGDNHTITTNNSEVTTPANEGAGILISAGNVKLENLKVIGPNANAPETWKTGRITVKVYGGKATLENVELTKGSEALQVSGTGTEVTLEGTQNYNDNVYNGVEVKDSGKLIIADDTTFTNENPSVVWRNTKDGENATIENHNSQLKMIEDKNANNDIQLGFAVASVGDKYYGSVMGAIKAIHQETDTTKRMQEKEITLLENCEGNGIPAGYGSITENAGGISTSGNNPVNIVLNLNGKEYTVATPATGSGKTTTNGFQFLKGSKVTIKNGTINTKSTDLIKILIKNYADLLIENVKINAGYVTNTTIANTGKMTIKGQDTVIGQPKGTWAITTGNYGHGDIITTDIEAGNVASVALETPVWEVNKEVTTDESVTINIKGGIIGKVGEYDWRADFGDEYKDAPMLTNAKMIITGGTFSSDPTAYVADGYVVIGNGPFTVGRPYAPSTPTDNVTNDTTDKNTTADLNPAVSDNKANTTVDADTAAKIVDKAVANKSTEVIIDAAAGNNVAASEVGIPEATVKELSEKTDANLVIKTDNGKVDLDKTALDAVAAQAGTTGTVKLIVETVKTDENICHVDLKLVTSNGNVTDFKGGNVKVTINLDKELAGKELVCVYINDNGIYTKVDGVLNADGTYTFTTGHFSEYAVMAKDEADKAIADQLNTLIKEVKLTARTSKTAKKNIKVTVNGDVTALKDAGYTVKYKFYRSTKKASKYVALKTKDTNTYTNTIGKKGTKYYYKARVLVYDGDTLVAQTALKQCKYGARFWTK